MKRVTVVLMALMMGMVMDLSMVSPVKADTGTVAQPGTRSPGVKKRKKIQNKRIKQGVKSGELTKGETKELVENRKETNKMIRDAKSDGSMTAEERKAVHEKLNQDSKDIYDAKHNDEKRK